jgi:Glycine-zipper domain
MEGTVRVLAVILLMGLASGSAWAGEPYIYPQKGQTPEQMEKDKFECYNWAKQQSGFDPMQAPQAAPAPPPSSPQPQGQVVGGAAKGAAVGAIGGAIGGDAGKGAAIGAATGAAIGGIRKRSDYKQQQAQYQQTVQQQQAQYQQQRDQYDRAFGACMEGRGYVLK